MRVEINVIFHLPVGVRHCNCSTKKRGVTLAKTPSEYFKRRVSLHRQKATSDTSLRRLHRDQRLKERRGERNSEGEHLLSHLRGGENENHAIQRNE